MQEQTRMVRAISEDTERPYFRIRYRLSVSGREMLQDALNGNLSRAGQQHMNGNGNAMDIDEINVNEYVNNYMDDVDVEMMTAKPLRQRRSKSVVVGSTHSSNPSMIMYQDQHQPIETSNLPTTPRTANQMPNTNMFSWDNNTQEFKNNDNEVNNNDETENRSSINDSNNRSRMKRTNSAGMLEMEVNRYGSPMVPLHHLKHEIRPNSMLSQGLVTCLNSKNVKKYTIGQPYRRGVIYGIDEEQGKIIVLHKDMPAGALTIMRTGNAKRYEKGYPVEDAKGNRFGIVHAIDRIQDLLVLNTTTANFA